MTAHTKKETSAIMEEPRGKAMTHNREPNSRKGEVKYERDLTVTVQLNGDEDITVVDLIKATRLMCGGITACRATGPKCYEITMSNEEGKEKLMDGFKMGNTSIPGKGITCNEMVVSFLNLPVYITDVEIRDKFEGWGVTTVSTIRRRMWPGTKIADGTRFVKVKFTDKVQSLPYSARFTTATGQEYFHVIHDRQVRVCRLCIQPGHILRECPDFVCFKCGAQGHYA